MALQHYWLSLSRSDPNSLSQEVQTRNLQQYWLSW